MQIKTLYLNLKDTSGKLNQDRRLDLKVTESLYKYGRMPKWTPKGYYRTILTPDAELQSSIDEVNELVYANLNNGVYLSGFAKNQEAYEEAVTNLFKTLDILEERLEGKDYLIGK